jgi:hypothetical protein
MPATSRYDVIVCAEILYYIPKVDVTRVVNKLANLLSHQGIVVAVFGVTDSTEARYFDDWNDALTERFECLALDHFGDRNRPYRIAVFAIDRARAQPHEVGPV